jgi:protein tyrosine/serine phosphatase
LKIFKFVLLFFYSLTVLAVAWIAYLTQSGNFYEIAPGVYRSHQLYRFNFGYFYQKYHFKTVLNLRGAKPNASWYRYEKKFCKDHNITLIDFKISDKKVQNLETMKRLVEIVKKAKKPILIHCRAGADRTGLVSALYLYSLGDKNASKMLSFKYGHISIGPTKAMDESFEKFKKSFLVKPEGDAEVFNKR